METESDTSEIPFCVPVEKGEVYDIHLTAYDAFLNLPIIFKVTGPKAPRTLVNGKETQDRTRFLPRKSKGQFCTVQIIVLENGYMEWETEIDFDQIEKDHDQAVESYLNAKDALDRATEAGATSDNFDRFKENHEKAGMILQQAREAYNNNARTASFDNIMAVIKNAPAKTAVIKNAPAKTMENNSTLIYRVERKNVGNKVFWETLQNLGWTQDKEGEYVHEEIVPAEPIAKPAPTGMLDERSSPMDEELQRLTEGVPPSPMELALAELTEGVPEPAPLPAPEPQTSELEISNFELVSGTIAWEKGPFPQHVTGRDPWAKPPIVAEASEPREPIHAEEDVTVEPVDVPPGLEVKDVDFDNPEPPIVEAAPVDQHAEREPGDEEGDEADEIDEAIVKGVREKTVPERTEEHTVEEAQVLHEREATVPPHILNRMRKDRTWRRMRNFKRASAALSLIGFIFIAVLLFKRGPETIDWTKRNVASVSNKAGTVAQDAKETIAKATGWTKRSYDSASDKAKAEWKDARKKIAEATATKPKPTPMPTVAPPEPTIVAEAPEPIPDVVPIVPLPMPKLEPTPQPEAVAEAKPTPALEPKPAAVAPEPEPKQGRLYASVIGRPQVDKLGRYIVEVDGQLYAANTTTRLENGRLRHSNLEPYRP